MTTKCRTSFVGRRAAENVFHAVRYADEMERPVNTAVCITFTSLIDDERSASELFKDLQARIGRWWRDQRIRKGRDIGPMVSVHVHANPENTTRHVHWLLHCPASIRAEFEEVVTKRLKKITGVFELGTNLHFSTVPRAGGKVKYILKGIEPEYAGHYFIRAANEGDVTGRRSGVSRSIGRAARKKINWQRKRSR